MLNSKEIEKAYSRIRSLIIKTPLITNETITRHVIISSIKKYPNNTPKIGIKYATWVWKTNPLTVNILNLNNQAKPVATTPR